MSNHRYTLDLFCERKTTTLIEDDDGFPELMDDMYWIEPSEIHPEDFLFCMAKTRSPKTIAKIEKTTLNWAIKHQNYFSSLKSTYLSTAHFCDLKDLTPPIRLTQEKIRQLVQLKFPYHYDIYANQGNEAETGGYCLSIKANNRTKKLIESIFKLYPLNSEDIFFNSIDNDDYYLFLFKGERARKNLTHCLLAMRKTLRATGLSARHLILRLDYFALSIFSGLYLTLQDLKLLKALQVSIDIHVNLPKQLIHKKDVLYRPFTKMRKDFALNETFTTFIHALKH